MNGDLPDTSLLPGARSLLRNGLMQNDLDAANHRIVNLDTSNLVLDEIPSQIAPGHQWFRSYSHGTHLFGSLQPNFGDIAGGFSDAQKLGIDRVGTLIIGTWRATPIAAGFVPNLSGITPPTAPVNMNFKLLENVADPIAQQDAVNLRTLQAQVSIGGGFQPKQFCKATTTANRTLSGLTSVDGYTPVDGDRILVVFQTDATQNGIYNAHATAWTRSTDADVGLELVGALVWVQFGTIYENVTWYQQTPAPIVIGTTPISFVPFSNVTQLTPGAGLEVTGNTIFAVGTANRIAVGTGIDIASNYAGQASITTLGTITTGTWQGTILDAKYGGTSVDNTGFFIQLGGSLTINPLDDALRVGGNLRIELRGPTTVIMPTNGTLATLIEPEVMQFKHFQSCDWAGNTIPLIWGGTGGTTRPVALNNLLPAQPGNPGEFLRTDGVSTVTWEPAAGPAGPGVPGGGLTGQQLVKLSNTSFDTGWAAPPTAGATLQTVAVNPPGTTNITTGVMAGLGAHITPLVSGKVFVEITGMIANNNSGGGAAVSFRYGTTATPHAGDPPVGAFIGSIEGVTGGGVSPFCISVLITGLTIGTPIWMDIAIQAVTIGTASATSVAVAAFEL